MSGLGGIDPSGMLNQVMQMVQQMTQQQQGSERHRPPRHSILPELILLLFASVHRA